MNESFDMKNIRSDIDDFFDDDTVFNDFNDHPSIKINENKTEIKSDISSDDLYEDALDSDALDSTDHNESGVLYRLMPPSPSPKPIQSVPNRIHYTNDSSNHTNDYSNHTNDPMNGYIDRSINTRSFLNRIETMYIPTLHHPPNISISITNMSDTDILHNHRTDCKKIDSIKECHMNSL